MTIVPEMTLAFFSQDKVLRNTGSLIECKMGIIDKLVLDVMKNQQLFWTEISVGQMNYFEIKWISNSWC